MPQKITYNKPHMSPEEILEILQIRGLQIDNKELALSALYHIGHFRLSGYGLVFQEDKQKHIFRTGTVFSDIYKVYMFDRNLRILLLDALERIEVSFRTTLNIQMSSDVGNDWLIKKECYIRNYNFSKLQQILEKKLSGSRDIFIKEYQIKYDFPKTPPAWMLLEIMDFGNWSMIYSGLLSKYQNSIKKYYHLPPEIMKSWIYALSYLRNLCAHHARVWNRVLTTKPVKNHKMNLFSENDKIYSLIQIIIYFLNIIDGDCVWKQKLNSLLDEFPNVDRGAMGFPV